MGAYSNTQFADIDVEGLAARGEQIYNEKYKEEFERKYWGQYAMIDIPSGKVFVGKTEDEAREKAHAGAPAGFFMVFGIGFDASDRLLTLSGHV
jgi:hypothetical protein